tara:strand:+ start:2022 stop:2243 length:222 start_codon:yes stop_codon:yes gene_type:complete
MKNIKMYKHKGRHWEKYGIINGDYAIVDNDLMGLVGVSDPSGDMILGEWLSGAKFTHDIAGYTYYWKPISGSK